MQHSKKKAAAVIALSAIALTGCTAAGSGSGTDGGAAAACTPTDGDVTLEFTTWVPGMEGVVDLWNKENPKIQVTVQTGPNGNGGTYQNFFNQIQAGDAPDLGQIEYDALPNFLVQDGVEDLSACADVVAAESDFVDWTWGQVTLGADGIYGIPQDTGPMALFYRADLFQQNGIAIPTTWDEYRTAAEQIRALGGYITNFSQSDINQFAGFAWQNGAQWFSSDDKGWDVTLTDDATTTVADFWQGMIDDDLVSSVPAWTDEWNNAYNSGQVWTWNSAVWGANSISSGAPDTAGNWAVAPLPQWKAGGTAAGNWGGSSTAVLKGSEHLYEATKFALWLNTSDEAITALAQAANLYPATKDGLSLPVYSDGVDFYGGQKIYDIFADAAVQVSPDFAWGPTMTQTYADVSDGFKAAVSGGGTLTEALEKGQKATIEALKSASIPVNE